MSGIFKAIALLSILIFLGCENDDDHEIDNINIISVTPSRNLEDGVEYNFIVEIEYDLATTSNGLLLIGFNTSVVNSYTLIKDAAYNVKKGIGFHTFEIKTIAKDWMNDGDFKVYVNISDSIEIPNWTPLVTDTESLYFRN